MTRFLIKTGVLVAVSGLLTHCNKPDENRLQGYVEGEFVYVASPGAGKLEKLAVQRGQQVKAGDLLFALENVAEKAARDQAAGRLAQAKATLEDAKKGRRPSEVESLEAQMLQAKSALTLAQQTLNRQEQLAKTGANAVDDLDRARSGYKQSQERVTQLESDLKTAGLGLRPDQITAAEEEVKALDAALARAEWDLSQKTQKAGQDAPVFDTLYREGEWVGAGKPVVILLPPANIKVRAFIPQERLGGLHQGDSLRVTVDGAPGPVTARVSFVSPQAEYTPPVIYSKESRAKLVFMVEAVFAPEVAIKLHPGQPVDVEPGAPLP
ncbi:MAG: multidrug resistance efflux pump [Verrucomicrobiaceae bacterium]|nr:multidrug resistance efflux pump [Verrucomicrobiaceae bacterium]